MHIQERQANGVMILDLHGKLTIDDGDELLRDKVNSVLSQGFKNIVLNLADVSFIDSCGLGATVGAFTSVKNKGGTLKLLAPTSRTVQLLVLTKLLSVFETFESEEAAVGSFAAG
jgi:anti-sigma B factor antagonist